jgi:glycosyltransferase involved in cell wall biosynthesis
MEIAIYHPWLKGKGGAEKVVLEMAKMEEHSVKIYTLFYDRESTFEEFEEHGVEVLGSNEEPGGFIDKGLRFGIGAFTKKLPEDEIDLLVVSEAGLGSLITLRNKNIPTICYCHTPLRAALPEFKKTYLQEQSFLARPAFRTAVGMYNILESRAWKNFDAVIANSETTKGRIQNKGLSDNVSVVNPGADVERNQHESYGDYFFYPSRFRRYKRQDLAIEAFKEADLDDFKLIVAGSAQEEEYIQVLEDMKTENIKIRKDVSGEEWNSLYANAYSVLFLAKKEDWGIIPVEAASYSKPVIAVNEGGPTESVRDGETGYLVEADRTEIADKMKLLAENPDKVEEMGKKAREHSRKYSWNSFREQIAGKIGEFEQEI